MKSAVVDLGMAYEARAKLSLGRLAAVAECGATPQDGAVFHSLLDRSIVFSYDRSGFRRHAATFIAGELETDQRGRVAVVTGASSGIGIEVARGLLLRGAEVILACRDVAKGERVCAELGVGARVMKLDVSDFQSIRAFAHALPECIDVLVHNAGALVDTLQQTAEGLELTVAAHLVGPLLLTHLAWPKLKRSRDARVIHVSSGGMYSERLDVAATFEPEGAFDGVKQYARAKRAQVVVTELLAERVKASQAHIAVSAMHPGWADTPGVATSLPRFHALTKRILRTPAEGADTVLFLALAERAKKADGRFYFDRTPRPTHLRQATVETREAREALWSRLLEVAGISQDAFE